MGTFLIDIVVMKGYLIGIVLVGALLSKKASLIILLKFL
jgi:hypothetical protein